VFLVPVIGYSSRIFSATFYLSCLGLLLALLFLFIFSTYFILMYIYFLFVFNFLLFAHLLFVLFVFYFPLFLLVFAAYFSLEPRSGCEHLFKFTWLTVVLTFGIS
jgi:hypothetical protein